MNNEAWSKDKLNRKSSGDFLKKFLQKKYDENMDSFILNINTEWGFGKTFFLENLALSLKDENYPVIYIDAWKTDFSEEPLIAIISEINDGLEPYLIKSSTAKNLLTKTISSAKKIIKPSLPVVLSILTKKLTNMSMDEFNELLSDENSDGERVSKSTELEDVVSTVISKAAEEALQSHNNMKSSINGFKENLSKLVNHIDKKMSKLNLPLFIFIDELDRCRPSYAIEVLENIKHLFGVDGVYFIVATDSKQLSYSINAVYGENFESNRYLRRFFDQEYVLPMPDWSKYSNYLFEKNNLKDAECLFSPLESHYIEAHSVSSEIFSKLSSCFDLSLRDQEQCCNVLKSIILVQENTVFHFGYLLFLIILKHKHDDYFARYVKCNRAARLELLEDMMSNGSFNKAVTFKSIYDDVGGGSGFIDVSFYEMIRTYVSILDKDISEIRGLTLKHGYQKNIRMGIINLYPSGNSSNKSPKHNLEDYHGLVLQAGQLN